MSSRSRSPRAHHGKLKSDGHVKRLGTRSNPLRLVTDCSGMEAPGMALRGLGISYTSVGAGDKDANVKKFWMSHFETSNWCDDITTRNHLDVARARGHTDLYVAGLPCQPWSSAGKHGGLADSRGTIVTHCVKCIEASKPNA